MIDGSAFILWKRTVAIEVVERAIRIPLSITPARLRAGVSRGPGEHVNPGTVAGETPGSSQHGSQAANGIPLDRESAIATIEKTGDR